ncbi:hypothetical protein IFM89_037695 [Coptis chinensis]|uniref:procollagen-proline 4-dioxygenase n=1 Tax=Coptis chinensis TaxID=261450 RepID=A0A835M5Y2_9MAGN|nr:hypothetical protein IFM89_037695 [Coptis chinensis]
MGSYRKELRMKNVDDQNPIKELHSSSHPTRVDPSRVIQLSWKPRVFLYRGFLSHEECNHLISLAQRNLENSSNPHTTSGTPLRIEQDDIVVRIEDRISGWTFLPKENSEPVQIMHYVHEDTRERLDYYGDKARLGFDESLMATVVLYLSNVSHGGETLFRKSESKNSQPKEDTWSECGRTGYAVKPLKGNALLFFNVQPNTAPDENSSNARCPVLQGGKWCATKYFYLRAIDRTKILLKSDSECTDEEDSCPEWAARGECNRNPMYMIGTPDYYGSCRKSCKVC